MKTCTFTIMKLIWFSRRVTVGVLQASLALEEELSLKAQLQKLLTVAKNLFTHLGEDNINFEGGGVGHHQIRVDLTSGKA